MARGLPGLVGVVVAVGVAALLAAGPADAAKRQPQRHSSPSEDGEAEAGSSPAPRIRSIAAVVRSPLAGDCAAAEQGNAEAAYRLARRYLFGAGVGRSRVMGVAWMRVAAARGHAEARHVLSLVPQAWGRMKPWCGRRPGNGGVEGADLQFGPVIRKPPEEIVKIVDKLAPEFGLDPALVLAVIQIESSFQVDAVSHKQAMGLMQLIPATARRFGVGNVFDPEENIRGGMRYLRWLLTMFHGDVTLALAGYNAGEHAVERHGGVPPYAETMSYVRLIHRLYPNRTHPYQAASQLAEAEPSNLPPRTERKPEPPEPANAAEPAPIPAASAPVAAEPAPPEVTPVQPPAPPAPASASVTLMPEQAAAPTIN